MLDVKATLIKILERLAGLRNIATIADDVFGNNTSGQTHSYTLKQNSIYRLVISRTNSSAESGVYIICAHGTTSSITALSELPSATGTVTLNALSLSVTCAVNFTRIVLTKLGGVIPVFLSTFSAFSEGGGIGA